MSYTTPLARAVMLVASLAGGSVLVRRRAV
jgi:hypothetical protein